MSGWKMLVEGKKQRSAEDNFKPRTNSKLKIHPGNKLKNIVFKLIQRKTLLMSGIH